jgi:phenylalanyl-tRNA synthetase alpha chain
MHQTIDHLRAEARRRLDEAESLEDLEKIRVQLLGRKGEITKLLRSVKDATPEERPQLGSLLNQLKVEITTALEERISTLSTAGRASESRRWDLTLPGVPPANFGALHPLISVMEEICDIFYGMGFNRGEGPDVELDYYNFTALNFPDDHPSRDIQDTFYINEKVCLRTQTSPVQIRTMERVKPPLAYIFPGRVYRNESVDASHTAEFFQIEGLCVDVAINLADLRDTVNQFVRLFFGGEREIRFRPHYFPFTEPSVEVDMQCVGCHGEGCGICQQTGWLEIMGAGMVHPNVFAAVGYDPDAYTGFAFGMGIDRISMLRYGITDIRLFYENDLRFLNQFRGVV